MNFQMTAIVLFLIFGFCSAYTIWDNLNLFEEHLPYFFYNNPDLKSQCLKDSKCPFQKLLQENKANEKCWGYETSCSEKEKISNVNCPVESTNGTIDEFLQKQSFWTAGDFGYVRRHKKEIKSFCTPQQEGDSSLECSSFLKYCRAKNIYMDFRNIDFNSNKDRFLEDLFPRNTIGGHCNLNLPSLKAEGGQKVPLQSWFAELENYSSLKFRPNSKKYCDVIIDKPTIFMKLDSGINLYHHFCDFINLYVSQHMNNSFNTDVFIVMWDTSKLKYVDIFKVTWKVFSKYSVKRLSDFEGKRVCFKDAMFSLTPRSQNALYFNMPLIDGCTGSHLFRAFGQHILHRLNITQKGPLRKKIRVTFLSRTTEYRKVLNENELVSALKKIPEFSVQLVDFQPRLITFQDQLKVSHNTDIFIGMHGSGLTHSLFLPDWAVLFELYNCEDVYCYYNLTNLRGIKYLSWQNKDKLIQEDEGHHPTLGAHAKFTNYVFEAKEFMRLIYEAADYVLGHPEFLKVHAQKYKSNVKTEL